MAYHYATHGVVPHLEPDEDALIRVDGRTGEVVSTTIVKRQLLDSDSSAQWAKVDQDWLGKIVAGRKVRTVAEALCLLYVVSRVRWSGDAAVNQSDLARMLGHDTPRSVNRAMGALVDAGVLSRVGNRRALYSVHGVSKGRVKVEKRRDGALARSSAYRHLGATKGQRLGRTKVMLDAQAEQDRSYAEYLAGQGAA